LRASSSSGNRDDDAAEQNYKATKYPDQQARLKFVFGKLAGHFLN
jgi:hypothetical protein